MIPISLIYSSKNGHNKYELKVQAIRPVCSLGRVAGFYTLGPDGTERLLAVGRYTGMRVNGITLGYADVTVEFVENLFDTVNAIEEL